jgi:two-component system, LytTR family, sensor kinase
LSRPRVIISNMVRVVARDRVRGVARALLVSVVVWAFLAIPLIYQAWMGNVAEGRRPAARVFVGAPLTRYMIMAVLTLPIVALTWRFSFRRGTVLQSALAHLAGFATFFVVYAWLRHHLLPLVGIPMAPDFGALLQALAQRTMVEQVWSYGSVVVAGLALKYYRDARDRAVGEAELRAEVARQQMQILKLQLHPHFLFNCLHGISSLMDSDIDKARTAITRFSDLLRVALEQTTRDEITLAEELRFIDSYLALEKLRLAERLHHTVNVQRGLEDVVVPTMVLQPLVENAIRHGIERRIAPGHVEIDVRADDGRLRISVVNDAARGFAQSRTGVGLSNTRGRLRNLYGPAQELLMEHRPDDRVEVIVLLPLRRRAVAELAS